MDLSSSGSFLWLQFLVNCSRVGLLQAHKSCQKTCSWWSSIHASTSPAGVCSRVSFPQDDFFPTASFGIHLLWCEVSYRLQVDPCSTGTSVGCKWTPVPSWISTGCLTMVCITDCSIWRSSSFLIFGICYFYYFRQRTMFL